MTTKKKPTQATDLPDWLDSIPAHVDTRLAPGAADVIAAQRKRIEQAEKERDALKAELSALRAVAEAARQVVGATTGTVPGTGARFAGVNSWHDDLYATVEALYDALAVLDALRSGEGDGCGALEQVLVDGANEKRPDCGCTVCREPSEVRRG